MPFEKPDKFEREPYFRRVNRFDTRKAFQPGRAGQRARVPETDQFGLSIEIFRYVSQLGREFIAAAIEDMGASKLISPAQQDIGTIPEVCVYGGLLKHGYRPNQDWGPKGFIFQSNQLGGRVPGGAVVDFNVYNGFEKVGVRVQGAFHAEDSSFGGGEKVEADELQRLRLLANTEIDRLVDVNVNRELENGTSEQVAYELYRITGRW